MRRTVASLAMLIPLAAGEMGAQEGLRDKLSDLFRFGNCGDPLCLPALVLQQNVHGNHYIPSAVSGNLTILSFLTSAIGTNVSNIPISATTSGATFSFIGGAPVKTTTSAGPVFAERAQTLGRGRLLAGANVTAMNFNSLRGVSLDGLEFNFTHANTQDPALGNPTFENDVIEVHTSLDVNLFVTSLFLTYGLTDRIDLGVSVPLVRTSLSGRSVAQVIPFGPGGATHYFGGTSPNPDLSAVATTDGSAFGIGDIAARVKLNLSPTGQRAGIALLGDVRLPTGKEEDLLGAGEMTTRILGIVSSTYGSFSPHLNAGAALRSGDAFTNSVLATAGFDHLLSGAFTLAFDVISEWQMGDSELSLPDPVRITQPYNRIVQPTNIPNEKDNFVSSSFGVKYTSSRGFTTVGNVLVPMNTGGLRASSVWTLGLEYSF